MSNRVYCYCCDNCVFCSQTKWCEYCSNRLCKNHFESCEIPGCVSSDRKTACVNCLRQCYLCGFDGCPDCIKMCDGCWSYICNNETKYTDVDGIFCDRCHDSTYDKSSESSTSTNSKST